MVSIDRLWIDWSNTERKEVRLDLSDDYHFAVKVHPIGSLHDYAEALREMAHNLDKYAAYINE